MKKQVAVYLTVILILLTLTACGKSKTLSGTYKLDGSGLLGSIASVAGVMESMAFSGKKVTVTIGGGITWTGTYTLDGTSISVSPADGGTGLSGRVSDDRKEITIAELKFVKE